jgi:hypothetical protein
MALRRVDSELRQIGENSILGIRLLFERVAVEFFFVFFSFMINTGVSSHLVSFDFESKKVFFFESNSRTVISQPEISK